MRKKQLAYNIVILVLLGALLWITPISLTAAAEVQFSFDDYNKILTVRSNKIELTIQAGAITSI